MSGSFTITMDTPGLLESIRAVVVQPRPDCQVWASAVDRGYGRVWVDGKARRVHRVVWELVNGPIPDGLTIDHLCRIRSCCNTEHMELVTQSENARRANVLRAAFRKPSLGFRSQLSASCRKGHRWTPETTGFTSRGHRQCLACRQARAA